MSGTNQQPITPREQLFIDVAAKILTVAVFKPFDHVKSYRDSLGRPGGFFRNVQPYCSANGGSLSLWKGLSRDCFNEIIDRELVLFYETRLNDVIQEWKKGNKDNGSKPEDGSASSPPPQEIASSAISPVATKALVKASARVMTSSFMHPIKRAQGIHQQNKKKCDDNNYYLKILLNPSNRLFQSFGKKATSDFIFTSVKVLCFEKFGQNLRQRSGDIRSYLQHVYPRTFEGRKKRLDMATDLVIEVAKNSAGVVCAAASTVPLEFNQKNNNPAKIITTGVRGSSKAGLFAAVNTVFFFGLTQFRPHRRLIAQEWNFLNHSKNV